MSYRPRAGLKELGGRLRDLLIVRRGGRPASARMKGKLRRAVVVPTPDALFSEAVFILRDEALRSPGLDREELLREASRAAESFAESSLPEPERVSLRPGAAFLLGAACAVVAVWALGLLYQVF